MEYTSTERRKPGRPALTRGQRAELVSAKVPQDIYDACCRIAILNDIPMSAVVRIAMIRLVRDAVKSI